MKEELNQNRYDQNFKSIIHRGTILSWLLRGCIDELKDKDVEEIKKGLDIGADGFTVKGRESEYVSSNGPVIMDNVFDVRLTDTGETVSVIVDVEAQNESAPYPLGKRAEYYISRMVSDQKGREFTGTDYGKIRRVFSIWVMMDPPKSCRNTIVKYSMVPNVIGKPSSIETLDTFNIVFVNLGGEYGDSIPDELRFVSTLFTNRLTEEERTRILVDKYKITRNEYPKQELREVGVFAEDSKRRYTREGRAEGLAEGEAVGIIKDKVNIAVSLIRKGHSLDEALSIVEPSEDDRDTVIAMINERLSQGS